MRHPTNKLAPPLLLTLATLLFGPAIAGCSSQPDDPFSPSDDDDADDDVTDDDDDTTGDPEDAVQGTLEVQNSIGRSGSYYLPQGYNLTGLPILVAYHGTGGSGLDMVTTLRPYADTSSFIIVAPDSRVSPQGDYTWEVGSEPGEVTEDLLHTQACLEEVLGLPGVTWNETDLLAAGYSGGGSSAPYMATNDDRFTASATLHGGVFVGGLGDNIIPAWFSTGEDDSMRPPDHVEGMAADMEAAGFPDVEFHVFPGGHELTAAELEGVVEWWLPG